METSLQNGDRLMVNKVSRTISRLTGHYYIPSRGEIVIFNQSGQAANFIGEKQLIKRVIALPKERVVVSNGVITVFNKDNPDGFNPDKTGLYEIEAPTTPGNVDVTLSKDEIFVCGDNRTNSEDSRYFGPVNTPNVIGKLFIRVLPLGQPHRL
jgi:signal peptidase I